jgi:hypothetical protein
MNKNDKSIINEEDKLKIQKAHLLFSQNNVENNTHLKHILRLALTFMVNKKFFESKETLEYFWKRLDHEKIIDNFKSLLKPLNISKYDNLKTNEILMKLFEEYSPKLKNDYKLNFKVAICFIKELLNVLNECFFSYMDISIYIENKNKSQSQNQNQNQKIIFKVN